jgi:hypothetical protein
MKTMSLALTLPLMLLIGCSTTHNVERAAASSWSREAVENLAGSDVTVMLRNGRVHEGTMVGLDAQQIILRNPTPGPEISIPMDSVRSVDNGSNTGWTILGFLGGAAAGGLTGAAIGGGSSSSERGLFIFRNLEGMVTGAAAGAGIGSILGAVIVGSATQRHAYYIVQTTRTSAQPSEIKPATDSSKAKTP